MVKANDILNQINLLLVILFPTAGAYINLCPKNFKRPAYLIECVKESRADVNCKTVKVDSYFTITYFVTVDDYRNSDCSDLSEKQTAILDLFRNGYITVGDRKIKVLASTGGMSFNEAYVDVQFEYNDDRDNTASSTPLIGTVQTNLQEG